MNFVKIWLFSPRPPQAAVRVSALAVASWGRTAATRSGSLIKWSSPRQRGGHAPADPVLWTVAP